MQEMKLKDQIATHENARHEIGGYEIAGQCEMQNLYSVLESRNYCVGSNFHVLHFHVLQIGPSISCPAVWSVNVMSCIFSTTEPTSIRISLHICALSCGAVYCNRPCLWRTGGRWGSVTTITRYCVHRSSPNWVCR